MKYIFFAGRLFLISCGKTSIKFGSLKGSVYYQDAQFHDKRADAEAGIHLFKLKDSAQSLHTTADVSGHFKLDTVPEGDYLLVIVSSHTVGTPTQLFNALNKSTLEFDKIFQTDLESLAEKYRDKIRSFEDSSVKMPATASGLQMSKQLMDSANYYATRALDSIPNYIKEKFTLLGASPKKIMCSRLHIYKSHTATLLYNFEESALKPPALPKPKIF
jgi:hypothetical protein